MIAAALMIATIAAAETPVSQSRSKLRQQFEQADLNRDSSLSQSEFAELSQDTAEVRRDFRMFDINGDGLHSYVEFVGAVRFLDPSFSAKIQDPFTSISTNARDAIDESYDNWNMRPGETVAARRFAINFLTSISPDGRYVISGRFLDQLDSDGDNFVNRTEAIAFVEEQLGIRWNEHRLRHVDGKVIDFQLMLKLDRNRDRMISYREYHHRKSEDLDLDPLAFRGADRDRSDTLTVAEIADPEHGFLRDVIAEFRELDGDLDARVSASELQTLDRGEGKWSKELASHNVVAFDDDGDGSLSLQEFRLSMFGNPNYPWYLQPEDIDQDGVLTFEEFDFGSLDLFQLQRRLYFHRFDRDRNGQLSADEFSFR